jgi:PTS system mannose-specific IIA component
MVGVVIVAHANLADEFIKTVESITGELKAVIGISINPYDDVDKAREWISNAIREVDDGDGILIITDMFGGTPSNLSFSFLEDGEIEVLTGLNLPMLVKLAESREIKGVKELANSLKISGQESIHIVSEILKKRSNP